MAYFNMLLGNLASITEIYALYNLIQNSIFIFGELLLIK